MNEAIWIGYLWNSVFIMHHIHYKMNCLLVSRRWIWWWTRRWTRPFSTATGILINYQIDHNNSMFLCSVSHELNMCVDVIFAINLAFRTRHSWVGRWTRSWRWTRRRRSSNRQSKSFKNELLIWFIDTADKLYRFYVDIHNIFC